MLKTVHSYSQLGQDLLVKKKFKRSKFAEWFCVDVGCHHPTNNNNTFLLYEMGARVLNIDPNPEFEPLYRRYRGHDQFICSAISREEGSAKYYKYSNSQWNGLSEVVSRKDQLIGTEDVPTLRLQTILERYDVPRKIDFLSVDTEGHELVVLQSVDFETYDIRCICLESRMNAENHLKTDLHKYMTGGYALYAHNGHDAIYVKRRSLG